LSRNTKAKGISAIWMHAVDALPELERCYITVLVTSVCNRRGRATETVMRLKEKKRKWKRGEEGR
jgi:hypothetical protein